MSVPKALLVSLAFMGSIPFADALGQTVPQPHRHGHPLVSAQHVAVVGLTLFASGLGDEGVREEFQKHRSSTTNAMSRVGNVFGEPLFVFPTIGVGYRRDG